MSNRQLTLPLMLGVALFTAGCGNDTSQAGECTSALEIDLKVTNDIEINVEGLELVINEVLYEISGNGLDPAITGTIDTSDPEATASVEVFGLLPGEDYLVELEATSEDEETTCRGSANFDVTVGPPPTEVHVVLHCSVGQRFGAVRADGWFNICAELIKEVVAPLRTSVGSAIIATSLAEDYDDEDEDVEYSWSSKNGNGSFADPSAASTFYTCEQTGIDTLILVVSDDDFEDCTDGWSVEVECVDENGTGGTGGGGTGGVGGTGGSGTGGTGGGGGGGGAGTGGTGNGSGTGGTGNGSGTGGTGGGGGAGTGGTGNGSGTGGTGASGGNPECLVSLTVN